MESYADNSHPTVRSLISHFYVGVNCLNQLPRSKPDKHLRKSRPTENIGKRSREIALFVLRDPRNGEIYCPSQIPTMTALNLEICPRIQYCNEIPEKLQKRNSAKRRETPYFLSTMGNNVSGLSWAPADTSVSWGNFYGK